MDEKMQVAKSDNVTVESLATQLADLRKELQVANASPDGYPISHYNVYVNGHPKSSPDDLQDALAQAAIYRQQHFIAGNGFPKITITKRTVPHPLRNDLVTETEVAV